MDPQRFERLKNITSRPYLAAKIRRIKFTWEADESQGTRRFSIVERRGATLSASQKQAHVRFMLWRNEKTASNKLDFSLLPQILRNLDAKRCNLWIHFGFYGYDDKLDALHPKTAYLFLAELAKTGYPAAELSLCSRSSVQLEKLFEEEEAALDAVTKDLGLFSYSNLFRVSRCARCSKLASNQAYPRFGETSSSAVHECGNVV